MQPLLHEAPRYAAFVAGWPSTGGRRNDSECGAIILGPAKYNRSPALHFAVGAPAGGVLFADGFGIRDGADDGADFDLFVAFDGGFFRTAAGFAPEESHFGADLDIRLNDAERE